MRVPGRPTSPTRRRRRDAGSAVVEFVLVAPVLLLVAVGVVQVALTMHARGVLTMAATEGARAAALAGAVPAAGVLRAEAVVDASLQAGVVSDISAVRDVVDGLPVMTVTITADLPLVGLLGSRAITVQGHALREVGS